MSCLHAQLITPGCSYVQCEVLITPGVGELCASHLVSTLISSQFQWYSHPINRVAPKTLVLRAKPFCPGSAVYPVYSIGNCTFGAGKKGTEGAVAADGCKTEKRSRRNAREQNRNCILLLKLRGRVLFCLDIDGWCLIIFVIIVFYSGQIATLPCSMQTILDHYQSTAFAFFIDMPLIPCRTYAYFGFLGMLLKNHHATLSRFKLCKYFIYRSGLVTFSCDFPGQEVMALQAMLRSGSRLLVEGLLRKNGITLPMLSRKSQSKFWAQNVHFWKSLWFSQMWAWSRLAMDLTEPLFESLSSMGSLQDVLLFISPWATNAADSGPNRAVPGTWDPEKLWKIIALQLNSRKRRILLLIETAINTVRPHGNISSRGLSLGRSNG